MISFLVVFVLLAPPTHNANLLSHVWDLSAALVQGFALASRQSSIHDSKAASLVKPRSKQTRVSSPGAKALESEPETGRRPLTGPRDKY